MLTHAHMHAHTNPWSYHSPGSKASIAIRIKSKSCNPGLWYDLDPDDSLTNISKYFPTSFTPSKRVLYLVLPTSKLIPSQEFCECYSSCLEHLLFLHGCLFFFQLKCYLLKEDIYNWNNSPYTWHSPSHNFSYFFHSTFLDIITYTPIQGKIFSPKLSKIRQNHF